VDWFQRNHLIPENAEEIEQTEDFNRLIEYADTHLDVLQKLPPTHLISAGKDPLTVGVEKLQQKLKVAQVPHKHDHFQHSHHGFVSLDCDESEDAIKRITESMFQI
jgi:acetyl esterase/lipase